MPPDLPGVRTICPSYLVMRDLAPGDTIAPPQFVARTTIQRIAGDSLPPGRYYLNAKARLVATRGSYRELWLQVPAGEIQLER